MNHKKKNSLYLLFIIFSLISLSCNSEDIPTEPTIKNRGEIVSKSVLSSVKADYLKSLLNPFNVSEEIKNKLIYDVDVYKIVYRTISPKGEIVLASGALFVPKGNDNLSLLSIHHGTLTNRNQAGSVNPFNAIEGFIGASLGYYSLVPDYLGLGESNILHPYHHAKSSADVVIDFIRAAKLEAINLNKKLNGQIFLIGYSEGGFVTLAAHREIEKNYSSEMRITASAPMAGAYDLYMTAQLILKNKFYDQPSFLAFLIAAYNDIYGWNNINSIFNSPYAEKIPQLFDGTKSTSEINAALTNDLTKLFKEDFITSFENGTEKEFTSALKENSLIDWVPSAPIKLYHGDADEYVPYENSIKARDYFASHGADVELVTIKNGTHISAGQPSIIEAIKWFESLKMKNVIAYQIRSANQLMNK